MKHEKFKVQTLAEVGDFLGVGRDRIKQLRTAGIIVGKPGAFDLRQTVQKLLERTKSGGEWANHIAESRARSMRARAERDERLERIAAGKLIDPIQADDSELDRFGLVRTEQIRALFDAMFENATQELAHRSGDAIASWIHARRLAICGGDSGDGARHSLPVAVHAGGPTSQAAHDAGTMATT